MSAEQKLSNHPALVLVCKRPALGYGKQRLAAQVGAESALQIAEHLLDCALEDLNDWPGAVVIAPDHPDACGWAQQQAPHAFCLAQQNGNLGDRLNALDRGLRDRGHHALAFIGSDAPALTQADYQRVRTALHSYDTVLIRARDGGVTLMASNRPWPDLTDLPWSTPRLGDALANVCLGEGHSVEWCGQCFDIDEQADLSFARQQLADDPRPARRALMALLDRQGDHSV
ncbi:DUF2064 domain-containing protein [Stutzerimonas stutzeri]|uniref:DUF2064 domain-containing protein n=1 Tax=Stutzerimonas stutzeri TaxID=316 RepID=UPI00210CFE1B|nr:DUF2064 domain-containing protein [Stutzerimonas stutzeri]MCQ4260458.1 DUF2064 domain-containing protein [Stutzerimonas stutzeri]